MPEIAKPTAAEVRRYQKMWISGRYSREENALDKLFQAYPKNRCFEDVLIKVSSLNTLYSAGVFPDEYVKIADMICELNIDERLKVGCPDLVEDIANGAREAIRDLKGPKGRLRGRRYAFATKYCSFHNGQSYPMRDTLVVDMLKKFKRRRNSGFAFKDRELDRYPEFRAVVERFREAYGLTEFSFREIDRYLWLLGRGYW